MTIFKFIFIIISIVIISIYGYSQVQETTTGDSCFFFKSADTLQYPMLSHAKPKIFGCTNPLACNYNPAANLEDNSCLVPVPGCLKCNHDSTALLIIDFDGDGICDAEDSIPDSTPYEIISTSYSCLDTAAICVPLVAVDTLYDIIGFDVVLEYDPLKVSPALTPDSLVTGNTLINPAFTDYFIFVDSPKNRINISLFLNGTDTALSDFNGTGEIFYLRFTKTSNFKPVDTAEFRILQIVESYITGIDTNRLAKRGLFTTYKDSLMSGKLTFWDQQIPVAYDPADSKKYVITNIYGTDHSCAVNSSVSVQPDISGNFNYSVRNGKAIEILKNLSGHDTIDPVINGYDAYLTKLVVHNKTKFIPNVYQIIAMDVNSDGLINQTDISQINKRHVELIDEFQQVWNYDKYGNPLPGYKPSKDWLFIDRTTRNTNPNYKKSVTYPSSDGSGYSKWKVPKIPHCLPVMIQNESDCPLITDEVYQGIMVGDIDSSWITAPLYQGVKGSNDQVIFDLTNAHNYNGYIDIPVSLIADEEVYSLDFSFRYNNAEIQFESVSDHTGHIELLYNSPEPNRVKFTSNSLLVYNNQGNVLVSLHFSSGKDMATGYISHAKAYVNGKLTPVKILPVSIPELNTDDKIHIYPNPSNGQFILEITHDYSKDVTISLSDVTGENIFVEKHDQVTVMKKVIDLSSFSKGIYFIKVLSADNIYITKAVIY